MVILFVNSPVLRNHFPQRSVLVTGCALTGLTVFRLLSAGVFNPFMPKVCIDETIGMNLFEQMTLDIINEQNAKSCFFFVF